MLKVGLTGGIASGKSTISQHFEQLGIPIIDTDVISHQLMQINQPAYLETLQKFGKAILMEDGNLDRAKLRKQVFNDPEMRSWLETMLHPLIRQETESRLSQLSSSPYVVVVVPLLFESGYQKILDHIIVIDCPAETQIQRLISRDNINLELAEQMLASQLSNSERLKKADSIIQNKQDNNLSDQIQSLHNKLKRLAQKSP